MTHEPKEKVLVDSRSDTADNDRGGYTTTKVDTFSDGSTRHIERINGSDGSETHVVEKDARGRTTHEKSESSSSWRDADGHELRTTTKSETFSDGSSKSTTVAENRATSETVRTEITDDGHGRQTTTVTVDHSASTQKGLGPISESRTTTDGNTGETTITTTTIDERGATSSHVTTIDADGNVIEDRTYDAPPGPDSSTSPPSDGGGTDPAGPPDDDVAGPPDEFDDVDPAGPPDDQPEDDDVNDTYTADTFGD